MKPKVTHPACCIPPGKCEERKGRKEKQFLFALFAFFAVRMTRICERVTLRSGGACSYTRVRPHRRRRRPIATRASCSPPFKAAIEPQFVGFEFEITCLFR